jgi:hypothetical protein
MIPGRKEDDSKRYFRATPPKPVPATKPVALNVCHFGNTQRVTNQVAED